MVMMPQCCQPSIARCVSRRKRETRAYTLFHQAPLAATVPDREEFVAIAITADVVTRSPMSPLCNNVSSLSLSLA